MSLDSGAAFNWLHIAVGPSARHRNRLLRQSQRMKLDSFNIVRELCIMAVPRRPFNRQRTCNVLHQNWVVATGNIVVIEHNLLVPNKHKAAFVHHHVLRV